MYAILPYSVDISAGQCERVLGFDIPIWYWYQIFDTWYLYPGFDILYSTVAHMDTESMGLLNKTFAHYTKGEHYRSDRPFTELNKLKTDNRWNKHLLPSNSRWTDNALKKICKEEGGRYARAQMVYGKCSSLSIRKWKSKLQWDIISYKWYIGVHKK